MLAESALQIHDSLHLRAAVACDVVHLAALPGRPVSKSPTDV